MSQSFILLHRRYYDRAERQFCQLFFCSLHASNINRLVSSSREQARHKPTVGVGGIHNQYCIRVYLIWDHSFLILHFTIYSTITVSSSNFCLCISRSPFAHRIAMTPYMPSICFLPKEPPRKCRLFPDCFCSLIPTAKYFDLNPD